MEQKLWVANKFYQDCTSISTTNRYNKVLTIYIDSLHFSKKKKRALEFRKFKMKQNFITVCRLLNS